MELIRIGNASIDVIVNIVHTNNDDFPPISFYITQYY